METNWEISNNQRRVDESNLQEGINQNQKEEKSNNNRENNIPTAATNNIDTAVENALKGDKLIFVRKYVEPLVALGLIDVNNAEDVDVVDVDISNVVVVDVRIVEKVVNTLKMKNGEFKNILDLNNFEKNPLFSNSMKDIDYTIKNLITQKNRFNILYEMEKICKNYTIYDLRIAVEVYYRLVLNKEKTSKIWLNLNVDKLIESKLVCFPVFTNVKENTSNEKREDILITTNNDKKRKVEKQNLLDHMRTIKLRAMHDKVTLNVFESNSEYPKTLEPLSLDENLMNKLLDLAKHYGNYHFIEQLKKPKNQQNHINRIIREIINEKSKNGLYDMEQLVQYEEIHKSAALYKQKLQSKMKIYEENININAYINKKISKNANICQNSDINTHQNNNTNTYRNKDFITSINPTNQNINTNRKTINVNRCATNTNTNANTNTANASRYTNIFTTSANTITDATTEINTDRNTVNNIGFANKYNTRIGAYANTSKNRYISTSKNRYRNINTSKNRYRNINTSKNRYRNINTSKNRYRNINTSKNRYRNTNTSKNRDRNTNISKNIYTNKNVYANINTSTNANTNTNIHGNVVNINRQTNKYTTSINTNADANVVANTNVNTDRCIKNNHSASRLRCSSVFVASRNVNTNESVKTNDKKHICQNANVNISNNEGLSTSRWKEMKHGLDFQAELVGYSDYVKISKVVEMPQRRFNFNDDKPCELSEKLYNECVYKLMNGISRNNFYEWKFRTYEVALGIQLKVESEQWEVYFGGKDLYKSATLHGLFKFKDNIYFLGIFRGICHIKYIFEDSEIRSNEIFYSLDGLPVPIIRLPIFKGIFLGVFMGFQLLW